MKPRIGEIPTAPKGHCRGCGGQVPKGRLTWCSHTCVVSALVRKGDPQTVRREVFARDRGVCAACGLDTYQVTRVMNYLGRLRLHGSVVDREITNAARVWLFRAVTGRRRVGHFWEADHVTPVIEGGGGCDLSGYRTLCVKCHKDETAKLAARRASQRKEQIVKEQIARWSAGS